MGLLPGDGSGLLGGKHPPRKRSPGWGSQGGGEHSRTVEERLLRLVGWGGKHPPGKHLWEGRFPRGKGYSGRILRGCPRGASSRGPLQGEITKVGMWGATSRGKGVSVFRRSLLGVMGLLQGDILQGSSWGWASSGRGGRSRQPRARPRHAPWHAPRHAPALPPSITFASAGAGPAAAGVWRTRTATRPGRRTRRRTARARGPEPTRMARPALRGTWRPRRTRGPARSRCRPRALGTRRPWGGRVGIGGKARLLENRCPPGPGAECGGPSRRPGLGPGSPSPTVALFPALSSSPIVIPRAP